jgi:chromosome segregation ATPase
MSENEHAQEIHRITEAIRVLTLSDGPDAMRNLMRRTGDINDHADELAAQLDDTQWSLNRCHETQDRLHRERDALAIERDVAVNEQRRIAAQLAEAEEERDTNWGWFLGCANRSKETDALIDRLGRRAAEAEAARVIANRGWHEANRRLAAMGIAPVTARDLPDTEEG